VNKLFRKFRRKGGPVAMPAPSSTESPTRPLPDSFPSFPPSTIETHPLRLETPQLLSGCGYSVGMQRDHNEDALFSLTTTLLSEAQSLPFGLYIVADGMGGHKHGEVASEIAVHTIAAHVVRKAYLLQLAPNNGNPEQSLQEILQEAIHIAHRAIMREAPGGGTTLTAGLILGGQMTIAHIGDSRAYLFYPNGRLEILTRDHSLVKRLEELGQISAEEAAIHPQRNVLYRALGRGDLFDAEIFTTSLPESGHLLICSDGLWGAVSDQEMYRLTTTVSSPAEACQRLIEAANAAGGPDNITVLLVRLPD